MHAGALSYKYTTSKCGSSLFAMELVNTESRPSQRALESDTTFRNSVTRALLCVILVGVVALIWSLISLPILFHFLPQEVQTLIDEDANGSLSSSTTVNTTNNNSNSTVLSVCTHTTVYTGTRCSEPLQSCSNTSDTIYISNSHQNDQLQLEIDIENIIFALDSLIQPSDECRAKVVPFLCLNTFGLCVEEGIEYGPSSDYCYDVRDNVCESEWQEANNLLETIGEPPLPDCSSFTDEGLVCNLLESSDVCTIECNDQFYCSNNFCKPHCARFREYSKEVTVAIDVLIIIGAIVGLLGGIAVLIISVVKRERMLTFPTIFVFYLTISLVICVSVALISFMDRPTLFCTSDDLLETLTNPSLFCKISGSVIFYIILQASLWWLFHISAIFWKVHAPLQSRNARHIKLFHGICVILALVLPLISITNSLIDGGFTITRFPPILCSPQSADAIFFTFVLPIDLIIGVGTTLLIVIVWKLHMQNQLFCNINPTLKTAERKILIAFLYYITLGVFTLSAVSAATNSAEENSIKAFQYFECEKNGRNNTCSYDVEQYPAVTTIGLLILAIFPAFNLVYAIKLQELKMCMRHIKNMRSLKVTPASSAQQRTV